MYRQDLVTERHVKNGLFFSDWETLQLMMHCVLAGRMKEVGEANNSFTTREIADIL